jgi:hypothetical protein
MMLDEVYQRMISSLFLELDGCIPSYLIGIAVCHMLTSEVIAKTQLSLHEKPKNSLNRSFDLSIFPDELDISLIKFD